MEITKIFKRLEDEGQKVLNYLAHLNDETWTAEIYTEGEVWTVHEILAHFVSVERAFQWLTADIVKGGQGAPEDFDLDRFNNEQVLSLKSQSRHELLSSFKSERAATIKLAASYDSDDMAKEGNHPWFGQVSVGTLLKLLYRHNQLHLRDIRRHLSAQPT